MDSSNRSSEAFYFNPGHTDDLKKILGDVVMEPYIHKKDAQSGEQDDSRVPPEIIKKWLADKAIDIGRRTRILKNVSEQINTDIAPIAPFQFAEEQARDQGRQDIVERKQQGIKKVLELAIPQANITRDLLDHLPAEVSDEDLQLMAEEAIKLVFQLVSKYKLRE